MKKTGAIIGSVCTLGALLLILSEWFGAGLLRADSNSQPQIRFQKEPVSRDLMARTSFAPIIKKIGPSVVTIYSTKMVRRSPLFDDPFFRRFFGMEEDEDSQQPPEPPSRGRGRNPGRGGGGGGRGRQFQEQSLGSGVIVTPDGYILSNNHVIEGADEIKVNLGEGRADLVAKVVGTDPATEIAVLKIDAKDLAPITITDSANLQVGDLVLAVGNPFGVGQTVTMGIVSAIGRGFGIVDYEDFIQTDASINPGNSGGALVDVEGRLVGINTAILSGGGGNVGVGFAVPINMARGVMEQLIKTGHVVRGYIGVYPQPVTPELAQEFKLPDTSGALVADVKDRSPAAQAGIQPGDIIVEFNGKKITDNRHLRLMASQTPPNTKVQVRLVRDGKEKTVNVVLGELPTEQIARPRERERPQSDRSEVLEGVGVTDLDARARRQFDIPENVRGALVVEVAPDSPAYSEGLRPGDVIVELNRQAVTDAQRAVNIAKKSANGRALLRVWSKGSRHYLTVEPSKAKP